MEYNLKLSAKKLLDSTNIIQILSQFGKVYIIGSYAFDLMVEPDVDIIVITNTPKQNSENALSKISKLHLFQKLEYGDFENFPRADRPPSYILNMRTPFDGKLFEIESWFLPTAKEELKLVETMKNINEEQKQKILQLKLNRKKKGISKHQLSSFEIYKQVLGLSF